MGDVEDRGAGEQMCIRDSPTGCSAATIAFAVGGFNPIKMLKFTLPYNIIMMVSLIISANIFFPVYG